jgi:hypothetical protein
VLALAPQKHAERRSEDINSNVTVDYEKWGVNGAI